MKKIVLSVAIMGTLVATSAQARIYGHHDFSEFAFDRATGQAYQQDAMRWPSLDHRTCGSAEHIDRSRLFGTHDQYGSLLPTIGQIDAELSQIRHISQQNRDLINSILLSGAEQIDMSIEVDRQNAQQRSRHLEQGVVGQAQVNQLYDASELLSSRSRQEANRNTMRTILPIVQRETVDVSPMSDLWNKSIYEVWSECRAYWDREIEANYPLSHLRPIIRGENRQF
jgi:hypothetical protein